MATKQEAVPEVAAKKVNHHVAITLRHLNERRKALLEKRAQITAEIEVLYDAPNLCKVQHILYLWGESCLTMKNKPQNGKPTRGEQA